MAGRKDLEKKLVARAVHEISGVRRFLKPPEMSRIGAVGMPGASLRRKKRAAKNGVKAV